MISSSSSSLTLGSEFCKREEERERETKFIVLFRKQKEEETLVRGTAELIREFEMVKRMACVLGFCIV